MSHSDKLYDLEQRFNALLDALSAGASWTQPTLLNGWATISGQARPALCFMDYQRRFICFGGNATAGTLTNGTPICNLGSAYRPSGLISFPEGR